MVLFESSTGITTTAPVTFGPRPKNFKCRPSGRSTGRPQRQANNLSFNGCSGRYIQCEVQTSRFFWGGMNEISPIYTRVIQWNQFWRDQSIHMYGILLRDFPEQVLPSDLFGCFIRDLFKGENVTSIWGPSKGHEWKKLEYGVCHNHLKQP